MSITVYARQDSYGVIAVNDQDRILISNTGVVEIPSGVLSIKKAGTAATIHFPVSTGNDPAYIRHTESPTDASYIDVSLGDNPTGDTFRVGYTNSSGVFIPTWQVGANGSVIDNGANTYYVRAWAVFNGASVPATILGSGNIAITDLGVGNYTATMASPMVDANYAALGTASNSAATDTNITCTHISASQFTIRAVRQTGGGSVIGVDPSRISIVVVR